MWKWVILFCIGSVIYMQGFDRGMPERRQLERMEKRIEKLEAHAKATSDYMQQMAQKKNAGTTEPAELPAAAPAQQ
jgi:uncharacterized protein (DUF2235 family)